MRSGDISRQQAETLLKYAEESGYADCMPIWMKRRLEEKVIPRKAKRWALKPLVVFLFGVVVGSLLRSLGQWLIT